MIHLDNVSEDKQKLLLHRLLNMGSSGFIVWMLKKLNVAGRTKIAEAWKWTNMYVTPDNSYQRKREEYIEYLYYSTDIREWIDNFIISESYGYNILDHVAKELNIKLGLILDNTG